MEASSQPFLRPREEGFLFNRHGKTPISPSSDHLGSKSIRRLLNTRAGGLGKQESPPGQTDASLFARCSTDEPVKRSRRHRSNGSLERNAESVPMDARQDEWGRQTLVASSGAELGLSDSAGTWPKRRQRCPRTRIRGVRPTCTPCSGHSIGEGVNWYYASRASCPRDVVQT